MDLRPTAVINRFRGKTLKYSSVSVVGTVITQSMLVLTHGQWGWNGVVANLFGVTMGSIPTYFLSRYWVWGKNDPNKTREIVAYWLLTLAGLALSEVFVFIFIQFSDSTLLVSAGNFAGFGVLWVVKFLILDEMLFHGDEVIPEIL